VTCDKNSIKCANAPLIKFEKETLHPCLGIGYLKIKSLDSAVEIYAK
jgi:hypothetical protein